MKLAIVEGRNVAIEFRWAEGQYDRLPRLAADLVQRDVAVIVRHRALPRRSRLRRQRTTIPIVFFIGGDPVKLALLQVSIGRVATLPASLHRGELEAKRLELLARV